MRSGLWRLPGQSCVESGQDSDALAKLQLAIAEADGLVAADGLDATEDTAVQPRHAAPTRSCLLVHQKAFVDHPLKRQPRHGDAIPAFLKA